MSLKHEPASVPQVQRLIAEGADVSAKDDGGKTALHAGPLNPKP